MTELQEEVHTSIGEFIKSAKVIKKKTAKRAKCLKKIKKKYAHLKRKKERLDRKKVEQAERQALA